jgi:regulator of PEP synthase PpsR (kinase-PPPase family)
MDPRKVLGLVLDPASLLTVRQARMRIMGAAPYSAYVDREGVSQEIERARRVFRSHGWRSVDTTGKAVEETASRVLELLGVDSVSTG